MSNLRRFRNPLFLDIETVSCEGSYDELSERMKALWNKKATSLGASTDEEQAALFFERAGIFAEFGKVVAIAIGYIAEEETGERMYVKGICNEDEKKLLNDFKQIIQQFESDPALQLCAHNGKEFDFPYLCRRMIVHGMKLPRVLDIAGKKPWEVNHLDTIELWKFGDRKNYTSLDLLGAIFDVPSSKEVMHGSEVNEYYYRKGSLDKIMTYCREDVVATIQVFRKMHCMPLLPKEAIFLV